MIQVNENQIKELFSILSNHKKELSKEELKRIKEISEEFEAVKDLMYNNEYSIPQVSEKQFWDDNCSICNNQFNCKKRTSGDNINCKEFDDVYG